MVVSNFLVIGSGLVVQNIGEWALLGALVFPPEGGAPEYRTFLLPREDYEINDTWHSMGLKATGSQTS